MFTGIIETTAKVLSLKPTRHGKRLTVRPAKRLSRVKTGQSISVNGVCLSVINGKTSPIAFDIVPETLRRSNLGNLHPGREVNLERALRYGDRLGGHYVQGHIEGKGTLIQKTHQAKATGFKIAYPKKLKPHIIPKGYISVDGISLTIGEVTPKSFTVHLIPVTLRTTNLRSKKPGDTLNLETDILLRTVPEATVS